MKDKLIHLTVLAFLAWGGCSVQAITIYQWKGTQTSEWMNTNNWYTPYIPAPTGIVSNTRMEVLNTVNSELIYDATMGTTVFAGTGTNPRSVMVGFNSSGQLRITGGILEGRGYAGSGGVADLIGGNGATGRLIIDGGTYLRTNDVPSGTTEFGAEMVIGYNSTVGTSGYLIVSNGLASVRHIRLNHNNSANASGIIRLDGGTLETYAIRADNTNGTQSVYFNGGTLKAGFAAQTSWISQTIKTWVQDGGAVFDTAGYTYGLYSPLTPDGASTGGLIKNGSGNLKLYGTNTYTGTTAINNGTLQIISSFSLPGFSIPGKLTVAPGATLHLNISTSNEWSAADIGTLIASNGTGFAVGSILTLDTVNGATTNSSTINATNLSLVKKGSNLLVLNSANAYTGLTTVAEGVLRIEHGSALGTTDTGTLVPASMRLELSGGITVSGEALTISGNGSGDGYGALLSVAGTNEWAGPITLGATQSRLGANNAHLIVSGPIGDNGSNFDLLIRSANGNLTDTVTLSGSSTYGGRTIIYQGSVILNDGNNRLPIGTVLQLGYYGTGNLLMGQLDLNGCNQELAGLEVNANMPDTQPTLRAQQIVKNSSETPVALTVSNTTDYTFSGRLLGNLGLIKKGSGIFTLSCTNAYSGVTAVSNGTLRLTRSDCLSTNAAVAIDTSDNAKTDLSFTGTQTVQTLSVDGKLQFRNRVYNAANLPSALSGTGNLRTTEGPIQGSMVQFF